LGLVGVERGRLSEEEFEELLRELGLRVVRKFSMEVRTRRGWVAFLVADVIGFTEGAASVVAGRCSAAALEAGDHTILGEVSAKLWSEAVKVVFPDGEEELVTVMTHDGFLNARVPTDDVRGLEGVVYVDSHPVRLPVTLDDLTLIARLGEGALERLNKLAQVYGVRKVLSEEVVEYLEELRRRRREEVQVSVDYETGFVLMRRGSRITTTPIPEYVVRLAREGRLDEAARVYEGAPDQLKEEIRRAVEEEVEILRSLGRREDLERLSALLDRLRGPEESQPS